uniref:Complement C1q A chain n=1 Tax=Myripristis murdjan TaxID=586833 RepID=A0A667XJH3_9TELE
MGDLDGLLVLLGVVSLLMSGQCSDSCRQDGRPGEAGTAGRDGRAGQKGERGEPAVLAEGPPDASVLLRLKGETGSRGLQGTMGPKGFRGELGPAGVPGRPGPPGPEGRGFGRSAESLQQSHSAFSVFTNDTTYPAANTKITFQSAIFNSPSSGITLNTGIFNCRAAGVYYFVFHATTKVSMCLRLASDALGEEKLGFCDYNTRGRPQVLSGGVVLQLEANQKVWLEAFRDNQPDSVYRDRNEKQIVFNGFLIF